MSHFRARIWTAPEIGERYDRSERFRKLVARAMKRVDPHAKPKENGREFAINATATANLAGEFIGTRKTPKYPDPELILRWIAEYKGGAAWAPLNAEHPYLDAVLGSLVRQFRFPTSRLASRWATISAGLFNDKTPNPFWFTRDVFVSMVPHSKMHRGFPLRWLKLRIPHGFGVRRDSQGNPYAVPATWSYRQINFDSPDMRKRFGEVWLGVSADGHTIWLASEKTPNVTLENLLSVDREGITEGSSGYHRDFLEPYATKGRVRGANAIPDALKPTQKAKTA